MNSKRSSSFKTELCDEIPPKKVGNHAPSHGPMALKSTMTKKGKSLQRKTEGEEKRKVALG